MTVELTLNRPRVHAENLVPLLSDALRYGSVNASEVDAVAVSSGPGSYTGLRIGASTAKGFAAASDAVLVEVPSLEALAYGARGGFSDGDVIVAAFDARRDEVFAAAFQIASTALGIIPFRTTSAVRKEDAVDWLGEVDGRVILVGEGAEKLQLALTAAGTIVDRLPALSSVPRAGAVAALGAWKFKRGETVDHVLFEPHYLKEFVAKRPSATAFEKLPF